MAIEIKSIPTLEGEKARLFIERVEKGVLKKISREDTSRMRIAAREILRKAKI